MQVHNLAIKDLCYHFLVMAEGNGGFFYHYRNKAVAMQSSHGSCFWYLEMLMGNGNIEKDG